MNKVLRAKQKLTSKINGVMYFQHSLKMTLGYNPVMSLMTSHILSAPETITKYTRSRYVLKYKAYIKFLCGFNLRFRARYSKIRMGVKP